MVPLRSWILAMLMAVAMSHDSVENAGQDKRTPSNGQNCGDVMEEVNVCMDNLHDSEEAKQFNVRREEIFKKCVPNQSAQCSGQASAVEKCQKQARSDPVLKKAREEIKSNVTKCYERNPNSRRIGGARPMVPGNFAGSRPAPPPFPGAPPPPVGFAGQDPCVPSGEQILCLKHSMDSDKTMNELGNTLRDRERQCFTKPALVYCRPDNNELRQCLDETAHSFMQQVADKIKICVHDAGYELPALPPQRPHGFSG